MMTSAVSDSIWPGCGGLHGWHGGEVPSQGSIPDSSHRLVKVAAMPPRLFSSGQRRDVSTVKRICPLAAVWTCPLMANAEGGRLTGMMGCPPTAHQGRGTWVNLVRDWAVDLCSEVNSNGPGILR